MNEAESSLSLLPKSIVCLLQGSEKGDDDDGNQKQDDKKKDEERQRANAFKLAGWPEGGPRLVKLLRAEWACIRTVESMFSKVLYVANLRTVRIDIQIDKKKQNHHSRKGVISAGTVPQ